MRCTSGPGPLGISCYGPFQLPGCPCLQPPPRVLGCRLSKRQVSQSGDFAYKKAVHQKVPAAAFHICRRRQSQTGRGSRKAQIFDHRRELEHELGRFRIYSGIMGVSAH
jgi:hypothetical protein